MTKTNTNNRSLQIAALLTIAVLTIGTMQFAAAKDDTLKLEGEFDDVDDGKAKFESRADGRMKFSVEITDLAVVSGEEYTIEVSGQIFSATATGNIIELNLDSQCNDGPTDNNCWLNPVELDGTVSVSGEGISTTATLTQN
jgi:hypothetical protein